MPVSQITLTPAGPLIEVGLSVPRAYNPWGGPPGTWTALIDTGADMTTISSSVLAALQPMRIGSQPVRRAGGGSSIRSTYDVRVRGATVA